jgi:protein-disulfide isomerase
MNTPRPTNTPSSSSAHWKLILPLLLVALALYLTPRQQHSPPSRGTATAATVAALTQPPIVTAAGATDADVTIVEFSDYNCPYCKATAPALLELLRTDPKVRIVFKDWPILGDISEYAARSALAADWQGKFLIAHDALIGTPHDLDEKSKVDDVLKSAGIDLTRLASDRTAHATQITAILSRNSKEADTLGFKGTPSFVIGRQLVPLAVTLQDLQQLTQNARASP